MPSVTLDKAVGTPALTASQIGAAVEDVLRGTSFIDIHTHLFMPPLGQLGLWGIDNLVTYHYLEAELFRSSNIRPEQYFALSRQEKAETIWHALFVENTPVSEAARGVIAVLKAFGLPTEASNLGQARAFFEAQSLESHIRNVFQISGISHAVMTNDPLDPEEAPRWLDGAELDPQFHPVLRLDRILNKWSAHWRILVSQGYQVNADASARSLAEVRRFLADWCKRMRPVYMAVSLPDTFQFPEDSVRGKILGEAVLPACREFGIPLSLMIGVRYLVNPVL